jgi:hypothetical protein
MHIHLNVYKIETTSPPNSSDPDTLFNSHELIIYTHAYLIMSTVYSHIPD